MFAPILAALLVSGPPARSANTEAAVLIANEIAAVLNDRKVTSHDLEVRVRNRRDVSISGRIDSIDGLKAMLDKVSPHAGTLTLRIGVACDAPGDRDAPDFSRPSSLNLDWNDDSWQQTFKARSHATNSSE